MKIIIKTEPVNSEHSLSCAPIWSLIHFATLGYQSHWGLCSRLHGLWYMYKTYQDLMQVASVAWTQSTESSTYAFCVGRVPIDLQFGTGGPNFSKF